MKQVLVFDTGRDKSLDFAELAKGIEVEFTFSTNTEETIELLASGYDCLIAEENAILFKELAKIENLPATIIVHQFDLNTINTLVKKFLFYRLKGIRLIKQAFEPGQGTPFANVLKTI